MSWNLPRANNLRAHDCDDHSQLIESKLMLPILCLFHAKSSLSPRLENQVGAREEVGVHIGTTLHVTDLEEEKPCCITILVMFLCGGLGKMPFYSSTQFNGSSFPRLRFQAIPDT